MSGHSKWHSIKHKKAAVDAKRGKLFTKLIREITSAARQGDPDPEANPRLRAAVANAKANNMPNDTIDRAIKKATSGSEGNEYEQVIYEGYGPANVAVVIEALTDNRNRTASAIRYVFGKHNGSLGGTNSVQFMFDRKGTIRVPKERIDEDTLTEYALEAGADDLDGSGEDYLVTCPMEDFYDVRTALEERGVPISEAELARVPQTRLVISDRDSAESVMSFLEALEEEDDVQKVFTNFDIDDDVLAQLSQ